MTGTQRFILIALGLVLAILIGAILLISGGDDSTSADAPQSEVRPTTNASSECAAVPEPSEIGSNPSAYPNLSEALLSSALCWDRGNVRPLWPDGITLDEALEFTNRVCSAPGLAPPTPQEWYDAVDGASSVADDFAAAIVNEVASGRSRGFGLC